jgi:glycosyltransferase involved in cell wall biosynthesis
MIDGKKISVIMPSFNDARIVGAIRSIQRFDDINAVRIIVIDGASAPHVRRMISEALSSADIFISEPDRGIFDALNKGLDAANTDYIGWLGSDDMFTGTVTASTVVSILSNVDLLVANTAFVRDITSVPRGHVSRVTHALPSRWRLARIGLHNPHYSTCGTASLLKSERFEVDLAVADAEYFLKIFERRPTIATLNVVATLQGEGGFSTRSRRTILRLNLQLIRVYSRHANWLVGPLAVAIKISYKILSSVFCRIRRIPISQLVMLGGGPGRAA